MAHKNKTNISPYKTRRAAHGKALGPKPSSANSDSSLTKAASADQPPVVKLGKNPGHKSLPKTQSKPAPTKAQLRPARGGSGSAPLGAQTLTDGPSKAFAGRHRRADVIFEVEEANDRLFDLFRNHGFGDFPHAQRRQLAQFYRLLMLKQNDVNMTRLLTLREVGLKHFVDCLMVAKLTPLKFPLMDLGTGPGLPGIPLKIQFPDETIVLAEGVQKRVEFLKEVRETMNLQKLPILGRNINEWCFYPVNGVITRAVEDVGNTLRNVRFCLQNGGRVYFMKGPNVDPEIDVAMHDLKDHYKLIQDTAYELPESGLPRRLLVFEKIKSFTFPDLEEEPWMGETPEELKTDAKLVAKFSHAFDLTEGKKS